MLAWRSTVSILGAVCLTGGAVAWKLGAKDRVLLTGGFHSVAHKGSGVAQIVQLRNGQRILRMIQPKTYPSTTLDVCLFAAPDAEDNDTVRGSGMVCLGSFRNSATYSIPTTMDLGRYRAVTLWDRSYQVNFTTAALSSEQ